MNNIVHILCCYVIHSRQEHQQLKINLREGNLFVKEMQSQPCWAWICLTMSGKASTCAWKKANTVSLPTHKQKLKQVKPDSRDISFTCFETTNMVEKNEGLRGYLCHMFGIIVENNRPCPSVIHNTSEGPGLTGDHQTDIPLVNNISQFLSSLRL